jgi:hypothetical protein
VRQAIVDNFQRRFGEHFFFARRRTELMQTEQSASPHGRRTMMRCLLDSEGRTKAHPMISKKNACYSRHVRGQGLEHSIWPPSNAIRDFLTPHIGIRALGGDNQCLPVCRCGTGKASAVSASLKLSIRSGEIFAVFRHRAEA